MLVAVDAGGRRTTGWATSEQERGRDLEILGRQIGRRLKTTRVVLAIEAPLWIPLRDQQATMTKARLGERMSWAGRVGAGVLVAGLANLSVILRTANPLQVVFEETTEIGRLVVLEAYCPSAGADHQDVAARILKSLQQKWPHDIKSQIRRDKDEPVLNLVCCVASALGISTHPEYLKKETRIIVPSEVD
jgi:hypothetical protein